jgi:hypothetical protein
MNKALQFSLMVCAVVALSVPVEAQSKPPVDGQSKPHCHMLNGDGSHESRTAAKRIAKDNLNQKIANLKQKAPGPGKVKVTGKSTIKCSGSGCKASQKVCLTDYDCDPEDCG